MVIGAVGLIVHGKRRYGTALLGQEIAAIDHCDDADGAAREHRPERVCLLDYDGDITSRALFPPTPSPLAGTALSTKSLGRPPVLHIPPPLF